MLVILIKNNSLNNFILPSKKSGSYWITDKTKDEIRNLINIEANDNKWILKSNFEAKIVLGNNYIEKIELEKHKFYSVNVNNEKDNYLLYCTDVYDNTYSNYVIKSNYEVLIGKSEKCHIRYNAIDDNCAKLAYNGSWNIASIKNNYGIYVNGKKVISKKLINGDIVFIMGLKMIILNNTIFINNINNSVMIDKNVLIPNDIKTNEYNELNKKANDEEITLYDEHDYFYRAPRFITSIEKEDVNIDPPPEGGDQKERPIMYTIGPMLTMAASSCVYGVVALNGIINNKTSVSSAFPTLMVCAAMLMTILLWPTLIRNYEKKENKKKEAYRQKKYLEYIESKKNKIENIKKKQGQILLENNISPKECQNIIFSKKRNLWERKIEHDDFLQVRLGLGDANLEINLNHPAERFTLNEDNLKDISNTLINNSNIIEKCPICVSLTNKNNLVVVGPDDLKQTLLNNLILQLITFQSYEDIKLVFMIDNEEDEFWKNYKMLPYCWSNNKDIRFFAENYDEMTKISFYLEQVFSERKYENEDKAIESNKTYKEVSPYYIIITNSIKKVRSLEIINQILNEKRNLGFSLIIINNGLSNLPNECSNYIVLDENKSAIIENDLNVNKQKTFILDNNNEVDIHSICEKISNIPIRFSKQNEILATSLGFLEMYNVGKIEQLNILNRWNSSSPMHSLVAPLGVTNNGELLNIDLHEKFHGPHGLIAGMTGSGKSELIMTFILSMAINYSPKEVQFVLIDYKGGGLAGAFGNNENGFKLPHLVGIITNLDTVELKRSLSSIQSELKRRQMIFNKTRDALNESTLDIYKYQKAYRDGLVEEPVSHLFIVCDEFAELKVQQPEFMEQLISIARLGRSLGVHLILATQKPSGVVDDQIWSNSKFRICLKVQEKSDSMDVIKRPDAASLKNAGRFYLQVGYNDLFALGQSAWCGGKYIPTDKLKKKIDKSLSFITNIGNIIKSADDSKKIEVKDYGEELPNIVNYINNIATNENIKLNKLWLDRIPDIIYVGDIKEKYNYKKEAFEIKPIIGEYDDPDNQRQDLLTLDLSNKGNTLIYGSTGSGKELLLSTIIYSTILEHSSSEVNFYILDFGSEILRNFKTAPQVGDVIFTNDIEKISNIFKFLNSELEKRKKELINYNGDYKHYFEYGPKEMPQIIVVINNYEAFSELYEEYQDNLIILTREGIKYGITFILTTSGINSIRYKLGQNFSKQLVLQYNEKADYVTILGNTNNVYPSKSKGRGIIRLEDEKVYEFQTAYPYEWDQLGEYLKIISNKLNDFNSESASEIAVLPERITKDIVNNYLGNLKNIPIGIEKNTLNISTYDLTDKYTNIIAASDINELSHFTQSIVKSLTFTKNINTIVIDTENMLKEHNYVLYYNSNFNMVYEKISQTINYLLDLDKNNKNQLNSKFICVIIGLDNFRNMIELENKQKFDKLLIEGQKLENLKFIFIDSITKFKKMEYEEFYRETIKSNYGIWVGDGISNQFVLKINNITREMRTEIDNNFGYVITRGEPVLIKLIDFEDEKVGDTNE